MSIPHAYGSSRKFTDMKSQRDADSHRTTVQAAGRGGAEVGEKYTKRAAKLHGLGKVKISRDTWEDNTEIYLRT